MIDYVIQQIKKIRKEKGISQNGLGSHLTFGQPSLSKVENKKNKLDVETLGEIAKALDVDINEFFPKPKSANKFEESQKNYGYASKAEIDDLTFLIKQLRSDIASLKKEIATLKTSRPVKKKKSTPQ